jgi:hypothetical protein
MEPFIADHDPHDRESVGTFVEAHTNFHRVIAAMAENRVLEILMQTVGQIVTHHVVVNADPRDLRELVETDHAVVARAIAAGHAQKAAGPWRSTSSGWRTTSAPRWVARSTTTSTGGPPPTPYPDRVRRLPCAG